MELAVERLKPEPSVVHCQHILVMCHGDRGDNGTYDSWWTRVPKPWEPPLANLGRIKALETGKRLRVELRFPIHRVVASPFRWAGLSMVDDDDAPKAALGDDGNSADSSTPRIKLSLDNGMCEMMNDVAQWYHRTDCNSWGFDIKELEASFPPGAVVFAPDRVFEELSQWGESESGARDRYLLTIHSLVDRYPEENLLFVTHGEGVEITATTYWKEARGYKIRPDYFGYVHLKRQIIRTGNSFTANRFRTATNPDETSIVREPPRHT